MKLSDPSVTFKLTQKTYLYGDETGAGSVVNIESVTVNANKNDVSLTNSFSLMFY